MKVCTVLLTPFQWFFLWVVTLVLPLLALSLDLSSSVPYASPSLLDCDDGLSGLVHHCVAKLVALRFCC